MGAINELKDRIDTIDLTSFKRVSSFSLADKATKTVELNTFGNYIVSSARSGLRTTLVYVVSSAGILNKIYDSADFTVTVSSGTLSITNNCGAAVNVTVMPLNN